MTEVLIVCNANLCRSPIAAAVLDARLSERGVDVMVRSAGLQADGDVVGAGLARTIREWGLDLSSHRSHRILPEDLQRADLVLAMEHHQVAHVVVDAPDAWARTFTLKEIVRRGASVGPRVNGEPFERWVSRIHAGRTRAAIAGAWHDDISDPVGQSTFDLYIAADEIDRLVAALVDLAWSTRP